jgi:HK97 family phage major capsid protein
MKKFVFGAASSALVSPGAVMARPRAEGSDPKALFEEINAAVKELRDTNDQKLNAKVDDVLFNEKMDKINAAISESQTAMAEMARKLEASQMTQKGREVRDPEYSAAFAAHIRKGEVQASLNKGADDEGGYTAPSEWDRTISNKLIEISPMRQIATVVSTGKSAFKKLVNLRGTASGWVGEEDARTETAAATFGSVEFASGELYANPAATQGLLDDAEVDIEAWLAGEINTEFAKAEGTAFVSGNGTNKPFGFLGYVTGGAAAARHPSGAIGLTISGDASTLLPDGVLNLVYALPSSFRPNAGFVMNRNTEGKVRLLKDGQDNYLWQPSYQAGVPATLLGYPITEMPDMPDVAANALAMAFGDFRAGYLINDRFATRIMRDPYTNKPFVQFYATKRVGGGVQNPEAIKVLRVAAS